MANYNSKKGKAGKTIALLLCGVLSAAAVAGAGTALYMGAKNNGWFEKDSEVVDETEDTSSENSISEFVVE